MGEECGGQVANECGSACPAACDAEDSFCASVCVNGFFCPSGQVRELRISPTLPPQHTTRAPRCHLQAVWPYLLLCVHGLYRISNVRPELRLSGRLPTHDNRHGMSASRRVSPRKTVRSAAGTCRRAWRWAGRSRCRGRSPPPSWRSAHPTGCEEDLSTGHFKMEHDEPIAVEPEASGDCSMFTN